MEQKFLLVLKLSDDINIMGKGRMACEAKRRDPEIIQEIVPERTCV